MPVIVSGDEVSKNRTAGRMKRSGATLEAAIDPMSPRPRCDGRNALSSRQFAMHVTPRTVRALAAKTSIPTWRAQPENILPFYPRSGCQQRRAFNEGADIIRSDSTLAVLWGLRSAQGHVRPMTKHQSNRTQQASHVMNTAMARLLPPRRPMTPRNKSTMWPGSRSRPVSVLKILRSGFGQAFASAGDQ